MKISTSTGIEKFDTVEVNTVAELAQKACESNISTSVFDNGKRNIASFLSADCIGLDIDNDNKKGTPLLSVAEAQRIFSEYKHAILSTRSHNVEKNGIVAERFRIILFPETKITVAEDFYCTWHWLKEQFPWIDNQCKDPSRFWFQHRDVLSVNENGKTITPIRYTAPEKPMKDGRPVLPGERGILSIQTLKALEFGIEAGSRNGTVYKIAREFQQALYEPEEAEARILASLERNGVISNDFKESEAKLAIRSAFSKDAKHAPRIVEGKVRAFSYQTLGSLLESPDKPDEWIVEGLLIKGGTSLCVGLPKTGKTTLIRQLEKCILRGNTFLDRKTTKGTIMHYSFDEKAKTAKQHYRKLGLKETDHMLLHFGTAANGVYLQEFEEDVMKNAPSLVVVDTLFDLVEVQDINNYSVIKRKLSFFNNLAEKSGSHIMFIHHQNKPNKQQGSGNGLSILGSTAILGSVDCCMIFEQVGTKETRNIKVIGRSVADFSNVSFAFDPDTMTYYAVPRQKGFDPDKDFF